MKVVSIAASQHLATDIARDFNVDNEWVTASIVKVLNAKAAFAVNEKHLYRAAV